MRGIDVTNSDPPGPLSFCDLCHLLLVELRIFHVMPSLPDGFENLLKRKVGVMEVKFDPFPEEAWSHFYVMMQEEPIVLTATNQTEHEMPLPEASVGEGLSYLVHNEGYYYVAYNYHKDHYPLRLETEYHAADYCTY